MTSDGCLATESILTCVHGCHGDGSLLDSEAVARGQHSDRKKRHTIEPYNHSYQPH